MAMAVDAVVGNCIEKLLNLAQEKVVMMLGVKAELKKLQRRMQNLSPYLEDVEGKIFKDKPIGSWLGDLKDIVYDVDDIIDLCRVEGTKLLGNYTPPTTTATSVCCYCPSISCFTGIKFRHEIGNKIQALNNRLEEIAKDTAILSRLESKKSVPSVHTVDYRQTSHFQPESDIIGTDIEEATHHLVKSLVDKEDRRKLSVFSIVGMGGIGKTTLARKVFNHASIVDHFPSRVWLCISQSFSETDLLKQVIRGVGGQCGEATSRNELNGILCSALTKKLFLVLDDIWRQEVWEDLFKSPLECGVASIQVLITTRHVAVARAMGASIHNVEKMNDHDGWVLLYKKVFGDCDDKEIMPALKDIGIKVIKKCDGLPLAIKVIGGILRSKERTVNDWEKVLLSNAWSITELPEELRGSLYLSYEDLRSELKQCFLFCSLYPEDHTIGRNKLIRFWVAEGFIRADGDTIIEDLAEDYYSQLIGRSLLQPVGSQSCNMHDLLRSLAQFLIGKENICLAGNASTLNTSIIRKLRRLSFEKMSESAIMPFAINALRSLRTMIFFGSPRWQILLENNIFTVLGCLRVLDLSYTSIESLPDSVGTLVLLRLLDLTSTNIRELPESMGTLVNLQTLNLHGCENLNTLPKGITRISSLRCLVVDETGLRHMPKGICQLKELNCLEGFIVGDDGIYGINGWTIGCNIEELENLSKLRRLSIYYLERASTDTPPETSLQHNYSKLPPLGQLPQLKSLDISGAYAIVRVGSEFLGCHAFPKLETLAFREMKNWEEWLLDGSGATSKLLPCLARLVLVNCPKLRSLPTGLGHATCLRELFIWSCDSLIEVKNLPSLAKLTIDDCGGLQRIFDLQLLAELRVKNCGGLQRISDLPLLAKLIVYNCGGLERISDIPLLAELRVKNCGGLQRISDLPLLGNLDILECDSLTHVANLDPLCNLTTDHANCLPKWLTGLAEQ